VLGIVSRAVAQLDHEMAIRVMPPDLDLNQLIFLTDFSCLCVSVRMKDFCPAGRLLGGDDGGPGRVRFSAILDC
jgi:hypothetical protein